MSLVWTSVPISMLCVEEIFAAARETSRSLAIVVVRIFCGLPSAHRVLGTTSHRTEFRTTPIRRIAKMGHIHVLGPGILSMSLCIIYPIIL